MNTCRLLEGEEWIFYQAAGLRMWSPKQQNLITQKLVRNANVEPHSKHTESKSECWNPEISILTNLRDGANTLNSEKLCYRRF